VEELAITAAILYPLSPIVSETIIGKTRTRQPDIPSCWARWTAGP
jgi:hypothetical protein